MQPERWQQIEEIYHAALEHEPARRTAFLAEACHSDEDFRREVESLLAQQGSLFDRSAWELLDLKPGTRLATYELISKLGEGGMGLVYRARDTKLNRPVAIKTAKPWYAKAGVKQPAHACTVRFRTTSSQPATMQRGWHSGKP